MATVDHQHGQQGGQQGQGGTGNGWYNGSKYAEEGPGAKQEGVQVFDEGNNGTKSSLQGKKITGGESKKFESPYSQTSKGTQKDYKQVIGDYTNKAYNKMNQSKIPNSMKDFIKGYFSGLN